MNRPDLDAIEKQCFAASPGKYIADDANGDHDPAVFGEDDFCLCVCNSPVRNHAQNMSNAKMFAGARDNMLSMIAYCRELEQKLHEAQKQIIDLAEIAQTAIQGLKGNNDFMQQILERQKSSFDVRYPDTSGEMSFGVKPEFLKGENDDAKTRYRRDRIPV